MRLNAFARALLIGAAFAAPPARAEDIDLFATGEATGKMDKNVIIVWDNSANWGKNTNFEKTGACAAKDSKYCYEKEALYGAVQTLKEERKDLAGLKIGLMLFGETGDYNPAPTDGGYPRYALRDMGVDPNHAKLLALFDSLQKVGDQGNNVAFATSMHEAYLYFQGMNARAGIKKKSDNGTVHMGTGPDWSPFDDGAFVPGTYTLAKKSGTGTYKLGAPPLEEGCASNTFVFVISNGPADSSINERDASLLKGVGGDTTMIPLSPGKEQDVMADEYARFLYSSHNIKTYTIDVAPDPTKLSDNAHSALLKSMADEGHGKYCLAEGAEKLKECIGSAFNEILSVSSTFASVALPVSVNVRGTNLNQVYMGMFRPDTISRWFGNLKEYQLAADKDTLYMADSVGRPVLSATTGFIVDEAVAYWTKSTDTYWDFRCKDPATGGPKKLDDETRLLCGSPVSYFDSPDGAVVEKGAQGQKSRDSKDDVVVALTPDKRTLYTCTTCDTAALSTFDKGNLGITKAMLGAADTAEHDLIIDWARGADNVPSPGGPEKPGGDASTIRPSIAADVLHSKPVVINYNRGAAGCGDTTGGDKDVVVFYGANDGILHAVKGGKNDITGAGEERWGFVPREFFGAFKRLRGKSPEIPFPAPVPWDGTNKPYLLDGNLSVYTRDVDGDCRLTASDQVYLFATMRRGGDGDGRGRFLYALDVSDADKPKLLWTHSYKDAGWEELGQTWSEAKPILLKDGTVAVMLGAGFDPGALDRPYDVDTKAYKEALSGPSMGRGVFVVNATTGTILRRFGAAEGMTYSIPSDINVVKDKTTGVVTRAYVGDTGGNLWRLDFTKDGVPSSTPGDWTAFKLASLGDPTNNPSTGIDARVFLLAPSVVKTDTGFVVLLGSGDRETPLLDTSAAARRNRFYMVKDPTGWATTLKCEGDASTCDLFNATAAVPPSDAKGWYFDLSSGEKVVGGTLTLAGTTLFSTNRPVKATSCAANLGEARIYAVNFLDGTGSLFAPKPKPPEDGTPPPPDVTHRSSVVAGGGFPPSPTATMVKIGGGSGGSGVAGACFGPTCVRVPVGNIGKRRFTYWYNEVED